MTTSSPATFISRIPPRDWLDNALILDCLMDELESRGISLYEAQEEAILALYENHNVILNTPTGSGKSLVATALHLKSLSWGSRSVYTCPIKALVNEKFLALCKDFGARNVGIITGDSSVNPDAPILCCTAEILSNMALRFGTRTGFDDVIMDEFHYYSDKDRGAAWQIPLLTLSDSRFLLMSATLGETETFAKKLTELNGLETDVIKSATRPVPLEFLYKEVPILDTLGELIRSGKTPIYLVHFTQLEAADQAQALTSLELCSKEEKLEIQKELEGVRFSSPYGKDMKRFLQHGVGLHHAGLLPKYRILVERLAQRGLLRIICGTDTLGVGINVPIRTVVFSKLCKFDGEKTTILTVRDFLQIAGRAGRKGFDESGSVVVQAPEHIVENIRLEQKAAGDPKKLRKIVRKKPPQQGFVPWNEDTFKKLTSSQPETLVSRFRMTHAILLGALMRERGGVEALRALIRDCHETEVTKKQLRKTAWELFRALLVRGIVEIIPKDERTQDQTPVRVSVDLQLDFSLNQELSLFLMDAIALLDREDENFAFRVLSLVESIQENPRVILRKQLNRAKSEKIAELKMAGMDYEDRMNELEKVDYPKPDAEWIYERFNAFQSAHPWVAGENIRPKSIAREMIETLQSFEEYIKEYELQRSEGILLRYLAEVYHALAQTVPDQSKTEELWSIEDHLGQLVRQIDSSLLDEWRKLEELAATTAALAGEDEENARLAEAREWEAKRLRECTSLARNAIHRFVQALASGQFAKAALMLTPASETSEASFDWTEERLAEAMDAFKREKGALLFNTTARSHRNTHFRRPTSEAPLAEGAVWGIEQQLPDENGDHDTVLHFQFHPFASEQDGEAKLTLLEFKEI